MKDKSTQIKGRANKEKTFVLILFIILLFSLSAVLYLYFYEVNLNLSDLKTNTTYNHVNPSYTSEKLGIKFERTADDYKITESDQTEAKEGFEPIVTPTLSIESPRFTLSISKYLDSSTFLDFFKQQRVPFGEIHTFPDNPTPLGANPVTKALSYSTDKEIDSNKVLDRSLIPELIIYYNIKGDSDSATSLYFVLNGKTYIITVKLDTMLNGMDPINYSGKYDNDAQSAIWNDYLSKKDLSEVESLINTIQAI